MILCIVVPPVGTVYAAAMKRFGVVLAGRTVVLEFPDGEVTCDDAGG